MGPDTVGPEVLGPGYRIEHFVIIEKIGQGGQAAVWSAYDERLRRTVAIKTINLSQFNGAEGGSSGSGTEPANLSMLTNPDRFREEAQIIAALEHPSILPVYAFGQEGDWLYIIMRYMPSGTLKDLLKRESMTPYRAAELLEPLAAALDLAHQNRIIHRDIKSANILLDAQLHPYLADFGLSMTKGSTTVEAGVGTLAYMSPEQMTEESIDHRSDLYSFGILMFELITGSLPFYEGQSWNLQQVMTSAPLPVPPEIPEPVAAVMRRATAFSPDDRYQSAVEAIQALKSAVSDAPELVPVEPEITDPMLLALKEAKDLFNRAQERWADGAGRFRFEAGDYKYVDSYYSFADVWELPLDNITCRLMLRGALEHGHNADYWWQQVSDVDDRRAVALQTLTSDLAPARQRAIEHLASIPDSTPPAIPIRVATVIAYDPDPAVQLAGIALLEKRAEPSSIWRSQAYSDVIDGTLADLAVNSANSLVTAAAARVIGRLHSEFAVSQIVSAFNSQAKKSAALNALVNIRDEVPSLPTSVPLNLRSQVFTTLSWRQLLANPLGLVFDYASSALACAILIGVWAYLQFDDPSGLLAQQRIGNALAAGVLYGALTGVGVFAAIELSSRLRAWNVIGRIVLALVVGTLLVTAAFDAQVRLFRLYSPMWQWLLPACAVFVIGFATAPAFTKRAWIRSLAGAAGVLLALYGSMRVGQEPLLYLLEGFDAADQQNLLFSIVMGGLVGLIAFLPIWIRTISKAAAQATSTATSHSRINP